MIAGLRRRSTGSRCFLLPGLWALVGLGAYDWGWADVANLRLGPDSPCLSAGRNGATIGAYDGTVERIGVDRSKIPGLDTVEKESQTRKPTEEGAGKVPRR